MEKRQDGNIEWTKMLYSQVFHLYAFLLCIFVFSLSKRSDFFSFYKIPYSTSSFLQFSPICSLYWHKNIGSSDLQESFFFDFYHFRSDFIPKVKMWTMISLLESGRAERGKNKNDMDKCFRFLWIFSNTPFGFFEKNTLRRILLNCSSVPYLIVRNSN